MFVSLVSNATDGSCAFYDLEVERFMATVAERYPDTPYSLKRSIDLFREHLGNPADDDDKAL